MARENFSRITQLLATFTGKLDLLRVTVLLLAGLGWQAKSLGSEQKSASPPIFERDVRPILRAHCLDCHGSQNVRKGGLDLRLRRLMVKGGESGPAISPGHPEGSYLLDRVKVGEMPPGDQKLIPAEIAILETWIRDGAATAQKEPSDLNAAALVTVEDREFWCFRSIQRPKPPAFVPGDRIRTPIDALLATALKPKRLGFSPDADRRTLIRRLSLDLLGLPPAPAEVDTFLADTSPDAYEKLVDRLLASPHYGERWGRHWLDTAGYADSEGFDDQDLPRPEAFHFRDYVIRAFNANKPFDQFVTEQLAGDELLPPQKGDLSSEAIDTLSATGFLRMAADGTASSNTPIAANQNVADTLKIVSTSLLGLTVGCAQCHDHRYDPILQDDYYRLRAVFEPALNYKNWRVPSQRRVSLYTQADRARVAAVNQEASAAATKVAEKEQRYVAEALDKELAKFDPSVAKALKVAVDTPADKRTAGQKQLLELHPNVKISPGLLSQYNPAADEDLKKDRAKVAAIQARAPVEEFLRVVTENPGEVPPTYLFYRGEIQQPKQEEEPGDLTVCTLPGDTGNIPRRDAKLPTSGRRLAYARRLMSGKHPLVGRVLVNRIWLHHFGRGLVATPADFGRMGERPTNPQLLDWLANEFAASGWNLKKLQRSIVTSTAYRQSSARTPDRDAADPDNLLLSRMNIRRLDAEAVRDSVLAASGSLFDRMSGHPIPVREDAVGQIVVGVENKVGANEPGAEIPIGAEQFRRSIYIEVRRSRPLALLRTFDLPVMETNCDRRVPSTSAPQALMLMNSEFALTQANRFAKRLAEEGGPDFKRQVPRAFEIAFARPATEAEIEESVAFLEHQSEEIKPQPATTALPKNSPKGRGSRRRNRATVRPTAADPALQPLTDFCQALLCSNEFLYSD
ncbi:MAG TPA: PSD1 and planctomycete cytochrome C domain-containing protein [Planctomycetaceae bacterium]|nr:PSD1 and planctomycete cytochrome C domain-containing protein [Planctomycetaceae bacterium]